MSISNNLLKFFAPKKIRTYLEFAESEIIMPDGVRRGLKYTSDFMPWDREFFNVLDGKKYNRFWSLGSVQSGKTFRVTVIPTLYHLFEIEEDVILCAPDERMANEFFNSKIKPIIKLSKYKHYLPKDGKGSRGGSVQSMLFRNGARLRFIGAGGGDAQRSGHTARIIVITEADKFDTSTNVSKETDPISQMESRAESFGDNSRLFAECTPSTTLGRVHREVVEWGSNSRCLFKCPHCSEYVPFERENFVGWQGKENEIDAREDVRYMCPECSVLWCENDRQEALRYPKMQHEKGKRTKTFGFGWNALSSSMLSMANIAQKEFVADRADTDDARRRIHQFVWGLPYDNDSASFSQITKETIINKMNNYIKRVAPERTVKITVGVDVGKYFCWYSVWAWVGLAEGYCIDYGSITVPQGEQQSELSILAALSQFKADTLDQGFKVGDEIRLPDLVLVDSGYETDIIYRYTHSSGSKYYPLKGFGTGKNQKTWRSPKATSSRNIGNNWVVSAIDNGVNLVELNSDHWKNAVHDGFSAPLGTAGNLSIYKDDKRNHLKFARHITAETKKSEFVVGKGIKETWQVLSRENHLLDTCCYARAGADVLGVSMIDKKPEKKAVKKFKKKRVNQSSIRTSY